jgi:hypothetical protein
MATSIQEIESLDFDVFHRDIVSSGRPVVIRSLVEHWPSVQKGIQSNQKLADYFVSSAGSKPVSALVAEPSNDRRLTYSEDLDGFNFERKPFTMASFIDILFKQKLSEAPQVMAMQGISVPDYFPGFTDENSMRLLDRTINPRLWIGNSSTVPTHYDSQENIACVVAGRRKFTLFPPEQTPNLYIGPLLSTPAGAPTSLVDLKKPNLRQFPKAASALEHALQAELEPGDAIYIPYLWWHNVESLCDFNVLINYWWGGLPSNTITPYQSLLHSLLSIPSLSIEKRRAWQHLFDFYVFRTDASPQEYLPDALEDIVTSLPKDRKINLQKLLAKQLML